MTENADPANGASAAPEDSALRPAESDLHPADPADDLTGNTSGGSTVSSDAPAPDAPAPDAPAPDAPAPDAPAPDAPAPVAALPGDSVPGDGAVEHDRPDVPDGMRTATTGREAAAARADTSDDRPTPTATATPAEADTVVIFAPLPILTVTIEDRAGEPDIHVHAGGQGVWQSRMVSSLGVPVVLCAALGGETGDVLGHLLPGDGITVRSVRVSSRNGAYVHDRREGEREEVADAAGSPLDRHERDSLYELTLTEGLTHGRVVLSGPQDDRVLPADLYRRLATDLGANGCKVAADLAGERLEAVLAGGPDLIKVSHEELLADGRAKSDDPGDLVTAIRSLRDDGAGGERGGEVVEVVMPSLEPADPRGAGDSVTAGVVAALAGGRPIREALQVGAACGALNVVRHGLGTGGDRAVETIAERVELRRWTPAD